MDWGKIFQTGVKQSGKLFQEASKSWPTPSNKNSVGGWLSLFSKHADKVGKEVAKQTKKKW